MGCAGCKEYIGIPTCEGVYTVQIIMVVMKSRENAVINTISTPYQHVWTR